jgi:hypothetical protein
MKTNSIPTNFPLSRKKSKNRGILHDLGERIYFLRINFCKPAAGLYKLRLGLYKPAAGLQK